MSIRWRWYAVKFQMLERMSSADSERVLVVLEQQLRSKMAGGSVEREGSRLVLWGLGPSPRALNPRDRAVIDVAMKDGATQIEAEVSFQASSLLGPVGQVDLVRNKLLRMIGAAQKQLDEEQEWLEMERRERLEASHSSSSVRLYAARRFDADSGQEQVLRPLQQTSRKAVAGASIAGAERGIPGKKRLTATEAVPAGQTSKPAERSAQALPVPIPTAASVQKAASPEKTERHPSEAPLSSQPGRLQTSDDLNDTAEDAGDGNESAAKRRWLLWAGAAACVAAIVLGTWQLCARPQQAPVIDLTKETTAPVPVKPVPTDTGPEGALRQWELALDSRDAATQTAYYAVPVDQYMWKHNVDRRTLTEMKQREIDRHHGQWTVRVDDVTVERRDDTALVMLVKHVIETPPGGGPQRERSLRCELRLKNSLGIWWITSERDLYP